MSSEKVTIYWGSGSPYAWVVLAAATFKGIQFEDKLLSFSARETRTPEFKAINPRGKVPTLVHGDFVVYESAACVDYIDNNFEGPALFPKDKKDRAIAIMRFHELANLAPIRPGGDINDLWAELDHWERYLTASDSGFLAKEYSSADVLFAARMSLALRYGLDLASIYPAIAKHQALVSVRPEVSKWAPPHWADGPLAEEKQVYRGVKKE